MLDKLIETVCAIAIMAGPVGRTSDRRGRHRGGRSSSRVAVWDLSASCRSKYVVGVGREADALGESMERYFGRIKEAFSRSKLSERCEAPRSRV